MHLVLITDRFDEEIGRLTSLGATPVNEVNLPAVRLGGTCTWSTGPRSPTWRATSST
jgi:hypothetical protein